MMMGWMKRKRSFKERKDSIGDWWDTKGWRVSGTYNFLLEKWTSLTVRQFQKNCAMFNNYKKGILEGKEKVEARERIWKK